ncbi:unnamed protein product [Laminaria digitata]
MATSTASSPALMSFCCLVAGGLVSSSLSSTGETVAVFFSNELRPVIIMVLLVALRTDDGNKDHSFLLLLLLLLRCCLSRPFCLLRRVDANLQWQWLSGVVGRCLVVVLWWCRAVWCCSVVMFYFESLSGFYGISLVPFDRFLRRAIVGNNCRTLHRHANAIVTLRYLLSGNIKIF